MRAIRIWEFCAKLKNEPRRGWTDLSGIERIESVADHSFGVAVLALFEAQRRRYDVERTLKLALIHDLEEAITGDLTPRDRRRLGASRLSRLRRGARLKIMETMGPKGREEYGALWRDLEEEGTREARLVKDLDKLEMVLQASHYEGIGVRHAKLTRFYDSAVKRMNDGELKRKAEVLAKRGH